jgi:serine/threonine protein kinase
VYHSVVQIPQGFPQRGDIIGDAYEVTEMLGAGAMGTVLKAFQPRLTRHVAIKVINIETRSDHFVRRFTLEAQALGQVSDPHVVTIHDYGFLGDLQIVGETRRWERGANGTPFLVLEYLLGTDLEEWLQARDTMVPVADAVQFITHACLGMAAAHKHGAVHRDLKPSNLFLCTTDSGRTIVKVTDFGLVKRVADIGSAAARKLTKTGMLVGTPLYLAPEQFQDNGVLDQRVDVWALGVILFQLLTRKLPFDADSLWPLLAKIANSPTPDPRSIRPEIPAALVAIVRRCLEKDPANRYQDVREMLTDLQSVDLKDLSTGKASVRPEPPENLVGQPAVRISAPERAARFVLRFVAGGFQGGEFPIFEGRAIVIGRSNACDINLIEEMVTHRHAQITTQGDKLWIEDLGSTNGTYVNGEKITRAPLRVGDRILIGTSIMKVVPVP